MVFRFSFIPTLIEKKNSIPRKCRYGSGSTIDVGALSPEKEKVCFELYFNQWTFSYLGHHVHLKNEKKKKEV